MATLDINGQRVNVDDSFLKLSHDEQQATVDHIAATLSPKAEPITVNNLGRSFATGVPVIGGLINRADAATNAALAPALNRFFDAKDQLPEQTFGERYAHSLRDQEGADAKFASEHPLVDTGTRVAAGVASLAPVVAAAPGLFGASGSFAARTGAGAASNAALGATDAAVRGGDPVSGGLIGAILGGAAPTAEKVLAPVISGLAARLNPEGYANRQAARAVHESGRPTAAIANDVTQAAAEGQGQFTLADALGNPGQRNAFDGGACAWSGPYGRRQRIGKPPGWSRSTHHQRARRRLWYAGNGSTDRSAVDRGARCAGGCRFRSGAE
jgi:hypothetical protein